MGTWFTPRRAHASARGGRKVQMSGKRDTAAGRRLPIVERRPLSDEEEEWIVRQLAKAPSLADPARRRIEQLLALPPDHGADIRNEPRAS